MAKTDRKKSQFRSEAGRNIFTQLHGVRLRLTPDILLFGSRLQLGAIKDHKVNQFGNPDGTPDRDNPPVGLSVFHKIRTALSISIPC